MHLSLIIPAYNEAQRITVTLRLVTAYIQAQSYSSEILVVDDGSTDGTAEAVEQEFQGIQVIHYEPNRGKGHAVRTGMLAATGAHRVFFDADASTPIEELEKLWPRFEDGADVVIGSRALPDSQIEVPQPRYRTLMGNIFNIFVQCWGLRGIPDTQCGFKGFSARAVQTIFPRQTIERFSFDAELLYIAKKHGLRIDQVPIRWLNSPHTTVNPITDASRMFTDLLAIRARDLMGRYS